MQTKLIMIGLLALLSTKSLEAQEAKFKALFLMKFCEYIEWPGGNNNLVIGVMESDDVGNELLTFASQKGNIQVKRISSANEAAQCNIVFVAGNAKKNLGSIAQRIGSNSTLLVADDEKKMDEGADIGFYLEDNKLRFVISKSNIESKKMLPSSKLLALGKAI